MWNTHASLFCDNIEAGQYLKDRYLLNPGKHPEIDLLKKLILLFIRQNGIRLSVSYVPSNLNPADPISRHPIKSAQRAEASRMVEVFTQHHLADYEQHTYLYYN
ncbi:hypothetical protein DFQ26_006052 [Actinomortierella ambigua]|nr:hypothetical protein DFQ26_006052 [Actinomortierella ambigua]